MKKVIERLRNPKIFMAVVSGILIILVNLGVIGVDLSHNVESTVNTILSIGIAIGIFSNADKAVEDNVVDHKAE